MRHRNRGTLDKNEGGVKVKDAQKQYSAPLFAKEAKGPRLIGNENLAPTTRGG